MKCCWKLRIGDLKTESEYKHEYKYKNTDTARVVTSKALINVDHIEQERWGPLLVDADWYAFCQALYKGTEGEDWQEMYESYKEMSRAVGVKKPQGAP